MFHETHIAATGSFPVSGVHGGSTLWTVNVNTGAPSAILTIYRGVSAAGAVVAVIDASSKSSHTYGIYCKEGIFAVLSGGNADCTLGYT